MNNRPCNKGAAHLRDSYLDAVAIARSYDTRDPQAILALTSSCCHTCVIAALSYMLLGACDKSGLPYSEYAEECMWATEKTYGLYKDMT